GFNGEDLNIVNQIPQSLTELKSLERIGIANIRNGEFKIPTFLNQLDKLVALEVAKNTLFPQFPEYVCELKNLQILYLNDNNINGKLPECLGELKQLKHLILSNNSIEGNIPESIGNLENLQTLEASNNFLRGTIPQSIEKLVLLKKMSLNGNHFQGDIPSNIGNLKALEVLNLSQNNLNGVIPESLSELKSLKILYNFSGNQMVGIPDFTSNLPDLEYINLTNSGLYGVVPNYPKRVTACKFDKENFCVKTKPACTNLESECTPELLENVEKFKIYQENTRKSKNEKKDDEENNTTKYIIALFIIIVPLIGILIFLRVYKTYNAKREDDLVVKQIDYINNKHTFFKSDMNSDTESDAQLLVAPEHCQLNTESLPRSIFNDTDLGDDDLENIEKEMIQRAIKENFRANNYNTTTTTTTTTINDNNNFFNSNGNTLHSTSPTNRHYQNYQFQTAFPQFDYNISSPYYN
ncbi:hypothetical protein PIROE2DRAFT_3684, partial [Piromyces sp. E2]